ncbi:MAG TPA: hypothetical protein PKK69_10310, partial [Ferruginibacter sp.]|nr:hypothetical protein [Ferruginibacter sp.]
TINQEIAYTSFESYNDNGWDVTNSARISTSSVTGSKSYSLATGSIVFNGNLPSKSYYVTYWLKTESGTANIGASTGEILADKQGWKLIRHKFTGITQLPPITGSGTIDELRLYPVGAFMKTITYQPGVGISSMSDENSIYQKYTYDGFNRLILIRDWDNNILRKADYQLQQDIAPCNQTNPDWQATGQLRCAKNNPVNNANTGVQEREEIDKNNCSATYLQLRWVPVSTNSTSCPVEDCSSPNYRMVNGVCMPGERLLLRSEYKGNMQWKCYFYYQWPDGFHTEEATELTNAPCIN